MITSTAAVEAAFAQLVAALVAEEKEFRNLGGQIFHEGAPRQAQRLLAAANSRAAWLKQIEELEEQWKSGLPIDVPPPDKPITAKGSRGELAQPGLIRNIKGMSESQAAEKLAVKPAMLRQWLEAGTLRGFRRVSGRWKVTQSDLVAFMRDHKDLLRTKE